jgi:hypothetical protein
MLLPDEGQPNGRAADATGEIIAQDKGRQMPTKKGLTVTIARVRRQTVTLLKPALRVPCSACRSEVEALTRSQAEAFLGIQDWELDALLAQGDVHTIPTWGRQSWVCKNSLFRKP